MKKRNVTTIAGGGGSLNSLSTRAYRDVECKSKEVSSASEQSAQCLKDTEARFLRVEQEKLVSKEENKRNLRAVARLNCHSGLDPESYQRWTLTSNAGKILKRVQDDSKRNNPITNLTSYRLNVLATCAGQGASLIGLRACGHAAFTMAEILLSLTIIGVVAAITLPSLTGNINERTWNTQRKAIYARFSQALALMPNLNGYGTLKEASSAGASDAEDTATETFITDGLSKVLKINNICDSDHLADCGIPDTITNMTGSAISNFNTSPYNTLVGFNSMFNGTWNDGTSGATSYSYSQLDTKAAAFETQNGESIVVYYNPNCVGDMGETGWHYAQPKMCANFVYDLNGNKGPNTVGKDIGFITALYPSDPVIVAPLPLATNAGSFVQTIAGQKCKEQDSEARLPNRDELAAMFYNRTLLGIVSGRFWSGSVVSSTTAWSQLFNTGTCLPVPRSYGVDVRCVRR